MEKLKDRIQNNPVYAAFSDSNEKVLSELTYTLRNIISELNNTNSLSVDSFKKLISSMEISNAVFSALSSREGIQLLLKLKAVTDIYKKNLGTNTNLIKTAEFLINKIEKFSSSCFHEADIERLLEIPVYEIQAVSTGSPAAEFNFKWITFERNRSFFISGYRNLEIYKYDDLNAIYNTSESAFIFNYNGKDLFIADMLKNPDIENNIPNKIIVIDKGKHCYAADRTGRKILSTYDLISPLIEPLEISNSFFPGRVRLFGRRYLLLKHD